MLTMSLKNLSAAWLGLLSTTTFAAAQSTGSSDSEELAKKLNNPVASLISVPFQYNYDKKIGPNDGHRSTLNIQPVIPFSINENWSLISRTIVPIIDQKDVTAKGKSESGFGDVVQSLFLSPKALTSNGWIWGVGPVFLLPVGSNDFSSDQWGIGPTAVALKQQNGWTFGALANHIWGFGADDDDDKVDQTFIQPFLSYTTADAWTFGITSESSYDWNENEWSAPVNLTVSKLTKIGEQPISFKGSVGGWLDSPVSGPDGVRFRFEVTFLFPE